MPLQDQEDDEDGQHDDDGAGQQQPEVGAVLADAVEGEGDRQRVPVLGGGDDQRNPLFDTSLRDFLGGFGDREINDRIEVREHSCRERQTELPDPRQFPSVAAKIGMRREFQCRRELQVGIETPQGDKTAAHSSGRTMDCQF